MGIEEAKAAAEEAKTAAKAAAEEVKTALGKPGPRAPSGRGRAIWGVVLIAVGTLFLLDRFDVLEIGRLRHWWPAILIGIGTVWIVAPERPRQLASGLSMVLLGFWFFACMHHWYGFTYRNAWPVIVMVYGVEIVLAAVLESRRLPKEERHV